MSDDKRKNNKGEAGRSWIWGKNKCYCPYCKNVFTYESMWKSLATDLLTVWDIVETLGLSWPTVRKALKRFNLEAIVMGTNENKAFYALSRKLGFNTPRDMFVDFIKNRYSYVKIGNLINKNKKEAKKLCIDFIGEKRFKKLIKSINRRY